PPSDSPPHARAHGASGPLHTAHGGASLSKGPREFAALLVDDLLRICSEPIAHGRVTGDIYRRVHEEIDVRWSLFATRSPEETTDHFYELLVEKVAGGDPTRFGPGMPDSTTQRRRRRKR